MRFAVSMSGKTHELEIIREPDGYQFRIDGHPVQADVELIAPDTLSILADGHSYTARLTANGVLIGQQNYELSVADPRSWRGRKQSGPGGSGPQKLTASMPGKVVRVLTSPGSQIHAGQGIAVIEAMKMQNELRAPREGVVKGILVEEGASVNAGDVIAIIE